MEVFIAVEHDAVGMGEFDRLGVESARPTFNVIATIRYGDIEGVASCNVEGHYYCSGSCNFDIEDISCSEHPEPLEKLSSASIELIWGRLVEEIDIAVSGSVLEGYGDRIAECMFADLGGCDDADEEASDEGASNEGASNEDASDEGASNEGASNEEVLDKEAPDVKASDVEVSD